MTCTCGKPCEEDGDTCFLCRVKTVGVSFHGAALTGRGGWNRSKKEYMTEHFGSADDRELGKRGIERVAS